MGQRNYFEFSFSSVYSFINEGWNLTLIQLQHAQARRMSMVSKFVCMFFLVIPNTIYKKGYI